MEGYEKMSCLQDYRLVNIFVGNMLITIIMQKFWNKGETSISPQPSMTYHV
jgi:hypothetical protein